MKNFVKVMAAFAFLFVAAAVVPNTASAADLAAPTGVRQVGATNDIVSLAWEAVPGADRYYWSWSKDGVSGWSNGQYDWNVSPEDSVYNLSSGSTYYFRVRAADTSNWANYEYGDWSQPIQIVTAPDTAQMGSLTLAAATDSSLTITWTSCPGATSYQIYDGATDTLIDTVTDCSYVKGGLAPNNAYSFKVLPVRTSETGYVAADRVQTISRIYTKPSKPVTPSTANFGLSSIYYNINVAYFSAKDPTGEAKGYELEVYTTKGKKVFTGGNNSLNRFTVKRNTTYKYRCRFFTTYGAEKIYGDWSANRYFVYQTVSGKRSGSRIKLSWNKVPIAKSYTVYISTKEKSGYKKVKTLSKKSTSLTIRKCGKKKINKKKIYYVKVVANLKDGAKSVKNDTFYVGKAS